MTDVEWFASSSDQTPQKRRTSSRSRMSTPQKRRTSSRSRMSPSTTVGRSIREPWATDHGRRTSHCWQVHPRQWREEHRARNRARAANSCRVSIGRCQKQDKHLTPPSWLPVVQRTSSLLPRHPSYCAHEEAMPDHLGGEMYHLFAK